MMKEWLAALNAQKDRFYFLFFPAFVGFIVLLGTGLNKILPSGAGDPIRNLAQTTDLSLPFTLSQEEPKDLDPHAAGSVNEDRVICNLFEGLVSRDPATLQPIAGVAEHWSLSPNGLEWTFTLRENARWSNGDPLTAEDFVYSWTRMLAPGTAAPYAYLGFMIKNGRRFVSGELKDPKQLGLTAVDAYTFKVTLEKPVAYFLDLLSLSTFYPVPRQAIEKFGKEWTKPEHLISNGAFTLAEWRVNDRLILRKNPLYWDADHTGLSEAQFLVIPDAHTEDAMFRTSKLDLVLQVPATKILRWQKDKEVFHSDPLLSSSYFLFNLKRPPLNDKRIRQALALALDRKKLTRFVLRGNELPAQNFTPPRTGGFSFIAKLPPEANVPKARKLLADAGYPNGRGFPTLELLFGANENTQRLAEAVQEMWRKNLNIKIKLHTEEMKAYLVDMESRNFQLAYLGWAADYNDPSTFLDLWLSKNGNNHSGFAEPTYDELVASADGEADGKKRGDLYQRAEDMLGEELPAIPIYYGRRNYLLNPRIQGWTANPLFVHPLKYLRIRPPTSQRSASRAG